MILDAASAVTGEGDNVECESNQGFANEGRIHDVDYANGCGSGLIVDGDDR